MPGIGVVFEAAPPLKYAEQVALFSPNGSTYNSKAFMSNFVGMKSLRLRFDYGIFRHFSWTFLGQECALELRLIQLIRPLVWTNDTNHSVEELVRCCSTLPHLLGGQALELDFSGSYFSAAFALRIIGLLNNSGREVTFRMTVDNSELLLDENEYSVDVDDTTTRYISEQRGIVVEVEGRSITIHSTADISRTHPGGARNAEMSPPIPLVE
ncbi:hypothetical protein AAVH_42957 [Aphelenchoides avenae]|nr:hypothetical protein AAVH_42957 [Aphelenchus avenae]